MVGKYGSKWQEWNLEQKAKGFYLKHMQEA